LNSQATFGLTVDIGTTWVTLHLVDLVSQKCVFQSVLKNPQQSAGLDVVSRIRYSLGDDSRSRWLTSSIRRCVDEGTRRILREHKISPTSIADVVVVGNTVMHHFFFGFPVVCLLTPPYIAEHKEAMTVPCASVGVKLGETTRCYSPPVIESYVGPDAIALMMASGLTQHEEPAIAIDIGTNTEIVLHSGDATWVASAASGPAFEGMSLDCGMAAIEGAIRRVSIDPKSLRPTFEVLGHNSPLGICGTGVISALAGMLDAGIVDSKGSMNRELESVWLSKTGDVISYTVCPATQSQTGKPIYISQLDLRLVQQSKAAIYAAVRVLMDYARLNADDVCRVYLTGSFGHRLNLEDVYRVGVLPRFGTAHIEQVLGAASIGADMIVVDPVRKREAEQLAVSTRYVELIDNPLFQTRYAEAQFFPPSGQ